MSELMSDLPAELRLPIFSGATVEDNLRQAEAAGAVSCGEDGRYRLAEPKEHSSNWVIVNGSSAPDCEFLIRFLFPYVYAKAAMPQGCSECYKVKVVPRSLRELVAAWGLGRAIACPSKWGVDLENPFSQNIYAGFFYCQGLNEARAVYRVAREAIDTAAGLGPQIAMSIKRGCSEYEAAFGPSDRYTFAPELAAIEAYLKAHFQHRKASGLPPVPMAHWIDTAFRIGDNTYLDFTQGRPLFPKAVSYDPA